jgi:hypothetical protein
VLRGDPRDKSRGRRMTWPIGEGGGGGRRCQTLSKREKRREEVELERKRRMN